MDVGCTHYTRILQTYDDDDWDSYIIRHSYIHVGKVYNTQGGSCAYNRYNVT